MNEARQSRLHAAAAWWAVPLRLIIGYGFVAHGLAKLSRGPSGFSNALQALGVPAPDVMSWATILVELIGGFAVLIGAFVPIASIPLAVVLLAAMFTVHLPHGFSSIKLVAVTAAGAQFGPPGYEVVLLYLASLAALVVGGSGPLSIDGLLASRGQERALAAPRAVRGHDMNTVLKTSGQRRTDGTSIGALLAVMAIAAASVACQVPSPAVDTAARPRFKAVAFDYLVLFDATSVAGAAEQAFPGNGRELAQLWRTRQFEYTWLRSITNTYVDFFAVTEDALEYAANAMKLELTTERKQGLLRAYLHLAPWPDTADALRRLREHGIRVIALANFSPNMLQANAENAGLTGLLDALVSTDTTRTYKPDPRAYQLGMERLQLAKHEILFAAFGGWDAAGAKAFGYPTIWVNRLNQPAEELGIHPDHISRDLSGLLEFVLTGAPARPHRGAADVQDRRRPAVRPSAVADH
jgi:2-haloacid dehalogenase